MSVLTKDDRQTLASYECVIKQGLETFVEVGTAFAAIRDGRLYRETHDTFEDYCHERWMLSRSYVNRVIAAAGVVNAIDARGHQTTLPESERQARPLASLPDGEQADAWNEAVSESEGQPTAAKVQEVVDRRKPRVVEENTDDANDKEDFIQALQQVVDDHFYDGGKLSKSQIVDCMYRLIAYAKGLK